VGGGGPRRRGVGEPVMYEEEKDNSFSEQRDWRSDKQEGPGEKGGKTRKGGESPLPFLIRRPFSLGESIALPLEKRGADPHLGEMGRSFQEGRLCPCRGRGSSRSDCSTGDQEEKPSRTRLSERGRSRRERNPTSIRTIFAALAKRRAINQREGSVRKEADLREKEQGFPGKKSYRASFVGRGQFGKDEVRKRESHYDIVQRKRKERGNILLK